MSQLPDSVDDAASSVAAPLVERLRRDAEAEANRRIALATADAASRVAAARATAEAAETASIAAHRRTLTMQAGVATASRSQAAARLVTDARLRAVARVLGAMSQRLTGVARGPEHAALVQGLLREITPYLPDGDLRVRAPRNASEVIRAGWPDAEIVEDDSIVCGAFVTDRTGRLRIDATLHGRLARAGAPLAIRIATSLDALVSADARETRS